MPWTHYIYTEGEIRFVLVAQSPVYIAAGTSQRLPSQAHSLRYPHAIAQRPNVGR